MDFYLILNALFEDEVGVASFHDAIFEACNVSHDDETLKQLFRKLPISIQGTAMDWGLSDTVFGDEVYQHIKDLGAANGKNERTTS